MSGPFVLSTISEVALDGYEALLDSIKNDRKFTATNPHPFTSIEFKAWRAGWNRAAKKHARKDMVKI